MLTIDELTSRFPGSGRVCWIGLRRARRGEVVEVQAVQADPGAGLVGDRYAGSSGTRHVTLIQQEHLAVIAALTDRGALSPALLRRNLAVAGINLLALKGRRFRVGDALLEYTGLCHPCSRMEEVLGEGGYNAMRGHGGITARVIAAGRIALADRVGVVDADPRPDSRG